MCIVDRQPKQKGPIVAWKLMEYKYDYGQQGWYGVRDFLYRIGKRYRTGPPGFQAFVNREDAEFALAAWPGHAVRKVLLYGAEQGIITSMDFRSNGKPGWAASGIVVPKMTHDR